MAGRLGGVCVQVRATWQHSRLRGALPAWPSLVLASPSQDSRTGLSEQQLWRTLPWQALSPLQVSYLHSSCLSENDPTCQDPGS